MKGIFTIMLKTSAAPLNYKLPQAFANLFKYKIHVTDS